MALYCFSERARGLYAEAAARGWLAAILDFPKFLSKDECAAAAQSVPDELRDQTCCIPVEDYLFRELVVYA